MAVFFLENEVQEEKIPHGFSLLPCPVPKEAGKADTYYKWLLGDGERQSRTELWDPGVIEFKKKKEKKGD